MEETGVLENHTLLRDMSPDFEPGLSFCRIKLTIWVEGHQLKLSSHGGGGFATSPDLDYKCGGGEQQTNWGSPYCRVGRRMTASSVEARQT